MAIAFDAQAEVAAGTGNLSYSHTIAATGKGIAVLIAQYLSGADQVSAVTVGGVAATRLLAVLKTTGEAMAAYLYFLGGGVPTGAQTIAVTVSGAASKKAASFSATGLGSTSAVAATAQLSSDSVANPGVTLATPTAVGTFVCGMLQSGHDLLASHTPNAAYTEPFAAAPTTESTSFVRKSVNGTGGNVVMDWTALAEDALIVGIAIREGPRPPGRARQASARATPASGGVYL